MKEHLHPADPIYLGIQISQLRFEIDNGREPDEEETLTLVQERFECERDEAKGIMKAVARTRELEKMAKDMMEDILPSMAGGFFDAFRKRA